MFSPNFSPTFEAILQMPTGKYLWGQFFCQDTHVYFYTSKQVFCCNVPQTYFFQIYPLDTRVTVPLENLSLP